MALNIKDPDTDRLARRLAEQTGETLTEAIRVALAERLSRVTRPRADRTAIVLREIIDRGRRRPILDERTPDELLGYDEHGLPS